MLKIFETVEKLAKNHLVGKSEEFIRGFYNCLDFFLIGIKSNESFNRELKIRELEKEIKDQLERIRLLEKRDRKSQEVLNSKSIIDKSPSFTFYTYPVQTRFGLFRIVTNLNKDFFYACLLNFSLKNHYESPEEAKTKLLCFINSKNFIGFSAYKDFKTFLKERDRVKKAYKKEGEL